MLAGAWLPASAQRSAGSFLSSGAVGTLATSSLMTQSGGRGTLCDTIPNLFTTDSARLYLNPAGWGYISGHNSFLDASKADLFTNTGSGQVVSAFIGFALADFGNAANTVRVSVWDDNGTAGTPGTVLGFQDIAISSFAADVTAGNFTNVTFTSPINVTGNFYLGIQLTYRAGDTVAIYTTQLPRPAAINTSWEEFGAAGGWYAFSDTTNSWGVSTSMYIVPVVCPSPAAPVANFSATPTTLNPGGSVTYTDLSSGSPTAWQWTFPGGTPSSSNLQTPPAITYSAAGSYNAKLKVTSANGVDSLTKPSYIQVQSGGGGSNTYVDCDTFTNLNIATVTPTLFPSPGAGYAAGHNFFGDSSKAEIIGNSLIGSPVSGVLMNFAVANFSSPTASIRVKVWNNNGTGGLPGTVLATQTVTISSIAADIAANRLTYVAFSSPATPAGDYYIGISYQYASGDTVALVTSDDGEVTPGTAYEQWNDGTWHNYNETSSWGLNIGHFIFPIQCATVPCPTIGATFTPTQPVCTASNGSLAAVGTGGLAPYTFLWSNSATTATINALAAGSYTVTVTDANGCTGTSTTSLAATFPTINPNVTTTPAVCTALNGSATVAPTGGTAPYTYAWSDGGTAATISNKAAATYSVTITDANGCSTTGTAVITASSGTLTASATTTPATCTAANGTATATPTGGTGPFTYAWSNGGTSATISGLVAGTFTVTVTDANGCIATATATVAASSGNLTIGTTTTNATCGAAVGTATVTPTGGTAPFTYAWSNSGTTATITALIVGTYNVTVTDANGCSATASASVTDPGSPTLTVAGGNDVSCFGLSDGAAAVTASGGATPYTYLWSTGATGSSVSGLPVGPISVTVTDGNGCQATLSGTINGPSAALSATVALNSNVTCPGAANGSLTVTAAGGTTPYTYTWSNGGTAATAAGLAPGTYTVTVVDANGCSTTASRAVAAPTNPVTVTVTGSVTTGCGTATGTATANASAGASPYTYLWSNGQTNATAVNLTSGNYSVTVTDAGGCTANASGNVTDPGAHTAAGTSTPVTCNGGSNGTATITVTGGSGNFTYTWSPSVSSTNTASALTAGSYSVTVLDNTTNCSASTVVNVNQPDTIGAQITQTNVTCPGGSNGVASVIATGGNGGYTYTWLTSPTQNGSTITGLSAGVVILQISDNQSCSRNFTVTITQPTTIAVGVTKNDVTCNSANNGSATATATGGIGLFTYTWSTTPAQNSATASGLGAGTYTVIATDANGCSATQSITISQPTALTATATATGANCFNGSDGTASVSANGGTGTLTYTWNTSPIQNTSTATNLRAGALVVTVTDANNCTVSATATVTQPTLINVTTTTTAVNCAGGADGTATASASGGTGTLTYQWPTGSGATASNLAAGTYTVTVTDANNCSVTGVATVASASGFTASVNTTATSCQGSSTGTATATTTGGVAPFTYAWSPSGSGSALTGLAAGTYSVTVTDANGCVATASGTVASASGITVNATPVSATCNGGNDGAVNITVSGGSGVYTYAWSNGTTNQNLSGVAAGAYAVTVLDGNGCSATATNLTVGQASAIVLTLTTTNETGTNANDGTATATSTGGTGLITYTWSNSATGSNLTNLTPGTYTVTATDGSGCSATASGTVSSFTGINNVGLVVSLSMFPNPSEDKINMSLTLVQPEAVTVEWYNAIGERVLGASFDSALTVNHTFDLSNMAAGVYYARIQYAGQTNVERVVLNK
jgi:PKD repeat protein